MLLNKKAKSFFEIFGCARVQQGPFVWNVVRILLIIYSLSPLLRVTCSFITIIIIIIIIYIEF